MIVSYFAALGIGAFFFENVFDFAGMPPDLPLFAFIFLVALGIDYNIFLMARVREETLARGTRAGTIRGLAVTGGGDHLGGAGARGHLLDARGAAAGGLD